MNTTETPPRKRPGWVLAISIFYFISIFFGAAALLLTYTGTLPIEEGDRAYLDSLTIIDHLITGVFLLAGLAGTTAFLLLKKTSYYIFCALVVMDVCSYAWHILQKDWITAIGGPGAIGAIIGLAINVCVCLYARSLIKRGILV